MAGADDDDPVDWEALYRLPRNLTSNFTGNGTEWDTLWNVTVVPNATWWGSAAPFDTPAALVRAAAKAVVLGLLILATVVGKETGYEILVSNMNTKIRYDHLYTSHYGMLIAWPMSKEKTTERPERKTVVRQ